VSDLFKRQCRDACGARPKLRAWGVLEHVISVDPVRVFKPSPKAYAFVEAVTGIRPSETMFVSSNGFDVAGAKRFGF
jgi:HAD superfamily hydrolase (TIGR01493 family)